MTLLAFFILLSIGVSFLCSLLEAVILSVTPSYLASLKSENLKLYKKVQHLKEDIEKPLASILSFNTVAHTVGAAGAGAQAQKVFGSEAFALFSAVLTFAILFFSEIIPKSIGASNWRKLLPASAAILRPMILIAYPLVWMSEKVSSLFKSPKIAISKEEIVAMADIGLTDGALGKNEHRSLKALIRFDEMDISSIFTPHSSVKGISEDLSIEECFEEISSHPFSRIPVFSVENVQITGYVMRVQVQDAIIHKTHQKVSDIVHPIMKVTPEISLPMLLGELLRRRDHICAVVSPLDESLLGIVTLEDLLEHKLDLEIYDEQDHLIRN